MKTIAKLFVVFWVIPTLVYAKDLTIKKGSMDFVMDAPLEKIKGGTPSLSGKISVDEADLKTVKGHFDIDVTSIKLNTFDDAEKNTTQTEHMLNWMEVGESVDAATKEKFKIAGLEINGAKAITKKSDSESTVTVDAALTLHGITKNITIELNVKKTGAGYLVKSEKPFLISLEGHDVRPRDLAGKLLVKVSETLGQKVAKEAQVNVAIELE